MFHQSSGRFISCEHINLCLTTFFLLLNNNVKVLVLYIYLYTFNPTYSSWQKIALFHFFQVEVQSRGGSIKVGIVVKG